MFRSPFSVIKVSRYACSIHACVNTIHSQRNDEHQDRNARGFASGGSGTLLDLRGRERGPTEREDARGGRGGRQETPQGSGFSTPVHQHRTPNTNENNVVVNQSVRPRTLEDLARDSRRILATTTPSRSTTKKLGTEKILAIKNFLANDTSKQNKNNANNVPTPDDETDTTRTR